MTLEQALRDIESMLHEQNCEWDYQDSLNVIKEVSEAIGIIKEHKLLNYVLKNKKCASMYKLSEEDLKVLRSVNND